MISVQHLNFAHGKRAILEDVSLDISAGEVCALMGCNGAGKTTLMRLICGDLRPDSGEIVFNDRPLRAWKAAELAQLRAVMTQNPKLGFSFAAVDVVMLGRLPLHAGRATQGDAEAAYKLLELVDAAQLAERDFLTLSGGEQQRIHLARALAQLRCDNTGDMRGRFLLLDEPTSNLDIKQQHLMLQLVRWLADAQGLGVVIIMHDLNMAAQCADRICLLNSGRVLACGSAGRVLTPEHIGAAFGLEVDVRTHPHGNTPLIVPTAHHLKFRPPEAPVPAAG